MGPFVWMFVYVCVCLSLCVVWLLSAVDQARLVLAPSKAHLSVPVWAEPALSLPSSVGSRQSHPLPSRTEPLHTGATGEKGGCAQFGPTCRPHGYL